MSQAVDRKQAKQPAVKAGEITFYVLIPVVVSAVAFLVVLLLRSSINRRARGAMFPENPRTVNRTDRDLCERYEVNGEQGVFDYAYANRCFKRASSKQACEDFKASLESQLQANSNAAFGYPLLDLGSADLVPFLSPDGGLVSNGSGVCSFSLPILVEPWYDQRVLGEIGRQGSFRWYNQTELAGKGSVLEGLDFEAFEDAIRAGIEACQNYGGQNCVFNQGEDPLQIAGNSQNTLSDFGFKCDRDNYYSAEAACVGCVDQNASRNLDAFPTTAGTCPNCPDGNSPTKVDLFGVNTSEINENPKVYGFFIPLESANPSGIGVPVVVPQLPRIFLENSGSVGQEGILENLRSYSNSTQGFFFYRQARDIDL